MSFQQTGDVRQVKASTGDRFACWESHRSSKRAGGVVTISVAA